MATALSSVFGSDGGHRANIPHDVDYVWSSTRSWPLIGYREIRNINISTGATINVINNQKTAIHTLVLEELGTNPPPTLSVIVDGTTIISNFTPEGSGGGSIALWGSTGLAAVTTCPIIVDNLDIVVEQAGTTNASIRMIAVPIP